MYMHHNVFYEHEGRKVIEKADGIASYTKVTQEPDGSVEVYRFSFVDTRYYTDKDNDLKVDNVFLLGNPFGRGAHLRQFERKKHFDKYRPVFEEADREFVAQLERFDDYIRFR